MSLFTYTYSIQNDIIVGKVDLNALKQEIHISTLVIALNDLTTQEDYLHITFKTEVLDKDTLDNLVEMHQGEPLSEGDVYDGSGKLVIHQTSKPTGFLTYWTCNGDDLTINDNYGDGECAVFQHKVGDPKNSSIYLDFNCVDNRTFLHEGFLQWKDCLADTVSLSVVTATVSGIASSGTNYNLYNGIIVVPANKDGYFELQSDISKIDGGLVFVPQDDDGVRATAFWNATWNTTTKLFEDISAAPKGDGAYNMFIYEYPLQRFINKIHLLGSGNQRLQSSDSDEIGQGMRVKIDLTTSHDFDEDHEWYFSCFLTMHREKTI